MIRSDSDISNEEPLFRFPKLMINDNVIAMMYNEKKGMVVARLVPTAVQVGDVLYENFDIELFTDYHGTVELENTTDVRSTDVN